MRSALLSSFSSLLSLLLVLSCSVPETVGLEFKYHDHEELHQYLLNVSLTYPDITYLHSIGQSVQGRELWVIVIGQSPREHVLLRPNVKYVANMHGNEAVGRELLLQFVDQLVKGYGDDDNITRLLNTTTIHIMPTMNPDGFAVANMSDCTTYEGRENANNLDLNRNFPDPFRENPKQIQKETRAVMTWIHSTQFVLSGNLHTGALVANYPFDGYRGSQNQTGPSICPDNDVFKYLARTYSFTHRTMHATKSCGPGRSEFVDGITNGAEWYPILGGMQDYNYVFASCYDLTLELSCCNPLASELDVYWDDNRQALMALLMQVHMGVKGVVTDENNNPLKDAVIVIEGRELVPFRTSRYGEYWKLLLPGSYVLVVSSSGYQTRRVALDVATGSATRQDVVLTAVDGSNTASLPFPSQPAYVIITVLVLLVLSWRF